MDAFQKWHQEFSSDAKRDSNSEFRRHIEYLGIDFPPSAMLEGTQLLLAAVTAYLTIDGRDISPLLEQQKYKITKSGLLHYCLTFDFTGKGVGRVLTDKKFTGVDFADLYNHPWQPFKRVGFHQVYISRIDGKQISQSELCRVYRLITKDMYFDYDESELCLSVNNTDLKDTIQLMVFDNVEE